MYSEELQQTLKKIVNFLLDLGKSDYIVYFKNLASAYTQIRNFL